MSKVLLLGAGLVAKPMVEYILDHDLEILIACPNTKDAEAMIKGHPRGKVEEWSITEKEKLDELISRHDLTVSLLPWVYHLQVAEACLRYKKPMVTTSYVKPEMQALDEKAKEAGVLFLNEIGLDPGIDHMSAMRIIDKVHQEGGEIEEFYSICGALPAPEACDNPLNYKFSWSPKGVVLASCNDAKYLRKGKEVKIEGKELFKDIFQIPFPGVGDLLVYPNRDSLSYIDIYNIPETHTMYRGTFRYPGWCKSLNAIKALDLLNCHKDDFAGMSYADLLARQMGTIKGDIKGQTADFLKVKMDDPAMKSLEFLGFFSEEMVDRSITNLLDLTAGLMISKMSLREKEKDMIALQHIFLASYPDGKKEVIKSRMLDFGSPSTHTSIARTVALPAAIAVRKILEGDINLTGVYRPVVPEIYNPVLDELETLDIKMVEEFGLPVEEMI